MVRDIRLVVTGFDDDGKNIWVSDGPCPVVSETPAGKVLGQRSTSLWAVPKVPPDVYDRDFPKAPQIWPDADGLTFSVFEIPPKSVYRAHPELVPKGPDGKPVDVNARDYGLHFSETVDLMTVISGEIWSVLEGNDKEVLLKAGDILIQCGTNHAWHNRSDKPCIYSVVVVSATRGRRHGRGGPPSSPGR